MTAESEKQIPQGKLEAITFAGKIVAVYRKCSCGAGEGSVRITRKPDGTNLATCHNCGATLEWGGPAAKQES